MENKKPSELGDLLDQIDAAPLLYVGKDKMPKISSFGACVSCGGKCYNRCKATTISDMEYNLPNRQPSLDREMRGDKEKTKNEYSITDGKPEQVPKYAAISKLK